MAFTRAYGVDAMWTSLNKKLTGWRFEGCPYWWQPKEERGNFPQTKYNANTSKSGFWYSDLVEIIKAELSKKEKE
jgi:hypothetical protein